MTINSSPNGFSSDFESVATEMTSYVEYVLKERERERERAVKEKERERQRKDGDRHLQSAAGLARQATTRTLASQSTPQTSTAASRTTSSGSAALFRAQGSATNPQGYYLSPPEANSPSTAFTDTARLSTDPPTQLTDAESGPGIDATQPPDPSASQGNTVEVMDAQHGDQELDTSRPENASFDMGEDVEMDVTEDDFNFWDEPSAELPVSAHKEPGQDVGLITQAPPADPIIRVEDAAPSAADPNDVLAGVQLGGPSQPDGVPSGLDSSEPLALPSNPTLPLSPAQTPPIIVEPPTSPASESSSSESSYSDSPDLKKPAIPPEFPFRVKEYVHQEYLPLPVTTSSILSDLKYSVPGGKFCFPPSNIASPAIRSTDLEKVEDPPIPTNAFIRSLPVPEISAPSTLPLPIQEIASKLLNHQAPASREVDALEKERSKRRAESRKLRERPIRVGDYEIWHSKKFVDKFLSNTDPRVKQVRRLRGLKRNLQWSPYPFLRTENDGDARSNWKNWADFTEILPSEKAKVLLQEDSSDEETITGDEEEITPPSEPLTGCIDAGDKINASSTEKADNIDPPKTPVTPSATATVPHGSGLLQTLFHPNHVYPLAVVRMSTLVPQQTTPIPGPISVPTPVSPAAHFIQGGEAALMVEGAADVVTREVIENPSWAAAYRAAFGWTTSEPVWASEADYLADLVGKIQSVKTRTSLQELATMMSKFSQFRRSEAFVHAKFTDPPTYLTNFKSLVPVTSPLVSVGQSNSVLHVSAPALRFWDKLGLSPLNGKKDIVSFALYEEGVTGPERLGAVSSWMKDVAHVYTVSPNPSVPETIS